MSIQAVAWALEQDVPRGPKLVLVSIANHANHVDGYCWLNATTIGREASCTPRSVYNIVGALVRNGFIRKALRRGEDGKQRANDYWILFDREEKPWEWGANPEADEAESDGPETAPTDADDTTSCEPHETISCGEPGETRDTRQPVEKHAVSPGPSEVGFTRNESLNHPNLNQKQESAGARVHRAALRAYKPPPPQPVAADTEAKIHPIFVFEGTPAYDAWAVVMAKRSGIRSWHLVTRKLVDGRWRSGWYFPTLFPPQAQPPPSESSTKGTLCTEDDMKQPL